MKRETGGWKRTLSFSWQRLLAIVLFVCGALVLGYGLIRPRVSAYVGQQVSQQINAELAREVVAALVGELEPPPQPAAPPLAPSAGTGADAGAPAQTAPVVAGQPPAPGAGQPAAPSAVIVQAAAAAPVDSGGLLRAIVAPPTAQSVSVAPPQAATQIAAGAATEMPAPTATAALTGDPAPAAPAPMLPTPLVATPISAPRTIEEIVEQLPSGEITVTEEKLNTRIGARAAGLGPIDRIVVRFVPGEVQVTLTVLGQDTLGTSQLTVKAGKVAAESPQISGALSLVISVADLVRPIEEELNSILETAGRQVRAVRIEQGQIVVTMD